MLRALCSQLVEVVHRLRIDLNRDRRIRGDLRDDLTEVHAHLRYGNAESSTNNLLGIFQRLVEATFCLEPGVLLLYIIDGIHVLEDHDSVDDFRTVFLELKRLTDEITRRRRNFRLKIVFTHPKRCEATTKWGTFRPSLTMVSGVPSYPPSSGLGIANRLTRLVSNTVS